MAGQRDHYATLGVSAHSDDVVIRAAFKALMLKYHPDTNKSPDATRRAMEINAAFAVLGDPVKRSAYDAIRRAGSSTQQSKSSQHSDKARPRSSAGSGPSSPPPPPDSAAPWPSPTHYSDSRGRAGMLALIALVLVGSAMIGSRSEAPYPTTESTNVTEMNPQSDDSYNDASLPGSADPVTEAMRTDIQAMGDNLMAASSVPEQTPLRFVDIEQGVKSFDRVLSRSGIIGARVWSERCHEAVRAKPSWAEADQCAAFDFAATFMDTSVTLASGYQQSSYFVFQSDNQADYYSEFGTPTVMVEERLRRIRAAVGPSLTALVGSRNLSDERIDPLPVLVPRPKTVAELLEAADPEGRIGQ